MKLDSGVLGQPLFGVRKTGTLGAIGTIVLLGGVVAIAGLVPQTILADQTGGTVVWLFNGYVGGVLLVTMVAATLLGVAYGVWNGGPVLAIAIPLSPVLTGMALGGEMAMTSDLTIALCSGAAGAVAGTETCWIHEMRLQSKYSQLDVAYMEDGHDRTATLGGALALSAALVVVGGWSLWTLFSESGLVHPGVVIGGTLLLVAGINLVLLTANAVIPAYAPSFTLFGRELHDVDEPSAR
jgi:hypothetical protein